MRIIEEYTENESYGKTVFTSTLKAVDDDDVSEVIASVKIDSLQPVEEAARAMLLAELANYWNVKDYVHNLTKKCHEHK